MHRDGKRQGGSGGGRRPVAERRSGPGEPGAYGGLPGCSATTRSAHPVGRRTRRPETLKPTPLAPFLRGTPPQQGVEDAAIAQVGDLDGRGDAAGRGEVSGDALRFLERESATGEVLQVDLVHDAGLWGHSAGVVERLLAPAEEPVVRLAALELHGCVGADFGCIAVGVHLSDGDDDDSSHGRVQNGHGGPIEALERHTTGLEGDLLLANIQGGVGGELLSECGGDCLVVDASQARLRQYLDEVGQAVEVGAVLCPHVEVVLDEGAAADSPCLLGVEGGATGRRSFLGWGPPSFMALSTSIHSMGWLACIQRSDGAWGGPEERPAL